jgi:hypothetical protein
MVGERVLGLRGLIDVRSSTTCAMARSWRRGHTTCTSSGLGWAGTKKRLSNIPTIQELELGELIHRTI